MQKDVTDMTIPELFDRFEKDILFDCHSLRAKASRSEAGKEIERRKEETIPAIQNHLASKSGSQNEEVLKAWDMILHWMRTEVSADVPI